MARIGHYELRELLGEGGIGRVYAGYDTVLQREVAIKSLRSELLRDSNFLARFRAEATSLARLNHPNITTVHALITEGRNLYMVMELVRGETVEDLLKRRNGQLGVREGLAIIAQAADGLAYAHSMGVIHRDIKPANLMITAGGLVKLMDFGIARARGSQRLTRDGSIVGTLAYMAPEQLRGEPGDERSDLYSLAIVLYEILSGAVPFSAKSDYELMQAQIHARPAPLSSAIPGVAGRIERAMMKALAKKPDQRFATVRQFKDALGATASPLAAANALEEADFSTDHDRAAWLTAGARLPLIAGGVVVVAGLVLWGALALLSESGSPSVTMNSPSGGQLSPSYTAAGSSKKPPVVPIPSPSDVTRSRAPAGPGPGPVVFPPPGNASSPPLIIK
jgi:serine/threonine protein kinase